jgi:D-alanyl-D-alanine carboxypeptidase
MAPAEAAALAPAASALATSADGPKPEARPEPKPESGRDLIAETIRATVPPASAPTPATAPAASAAPAAPPVVHTGWMIQVGAFDVEKDAHDRLAAVQAKVGHLLKHADPFTEAVTTGDKTLYRARFAGIQKEQAEAVCRQLKRNDIACMTIRN